MVAVLNGKFLPQKAVLVIDMPKDCRRCQLMVDRFCYGIPMDEVHDNININERPSWCPLRPLPEGHGDLIDRKDLIENGLRKGFCDWYDEIKMADAIIESDRGETE